MVVDVVATALKHSFLAAAQPHSAISRLLALSDLYRVGWWIIGLTAVLPNLFSTLVRWLSPLSVADDPLGAVSGGKLAQFVVGVLVVLLAAFANMFIWSNVYGFAAKSKEVFAASVLSVGIGLVLYPLMTISEYVGFSPSSNVGLGLSLVALAVSLILSTVFFATALGVSNKSAFIRSLGVFVVVSVATMLFGILSFRILGVPLPGPS